MSGQVLVGVDVGGTFTDFVVWRNGELLIYKTPTTPDDQSRAIVQGLAALGLAGDDSAHPAFSIIHGMTVATNALLERRGARTALLTTAGFRDVLALGRQNRPHLYRLSQQRPPLIVPDELRLEISERLAATGEVLQALDVSAVPAIVQQLVAGDVESLAVVFLFSFRNPAHERSVAAQIRALAPDLPISLSCDVLPEYREYERTATTVINAYVQPLVARYLARLEAVASTPIHIMQSNGGVVGLHQAAAQAASVVLSGPAGGAVGAFAVAQQAERANGAAADACNILTFDMGGTSTDVCLCPGQIPTTAESVIGDLPLRLPIIDIHTVGAGGGSIAFIDRGGALQVGPHSAGAVPGPVCYGRGGVEPTVTDANLVLGRLEPAGFLGGGGAVQLDRAAAQRALAGLGTQLGLTPEAAALGVVRVANATMERALRTVSVEQGYDPRLFSLLPFGGAGPLHACDLAEALSMRKILCPLIPGVLSAFGMLVADVKTDVSQSVLRPLGVLLEDPGSLQGVLDELAARLRTTLAAEQIGAATFTAALDLRYRGQSYELTAPLPLPLSGQAITTARDAFHALHAQRYGYAMTDAPIEAVTLRLRATAPGAQLALPELPAGGRDPEDALLAVRPCWFEPAAPTATACYRRDRLLPGNRFAGPALVFQYDSTIVINPGWSVTVDTYGNLVLQFG